MDLKKIVFSLSLLITYVWITNAQTTIFTEDFETGAPAVSTKMSTAVNGWQNDVVASTGSNNQWWMLLPTHHTLNATNAIGVSKGTLGTTGNLPVFIANTSPYNNVAKCNTLINASTYNSLTLDFDWAGTGNGANAFGKDCYSTNGTTWIDFPTSGTYNGQTTSQSVTNLDISAVDNIVVKGTFVAPTDNDDCLGAYNIPVNSGTACSSFLDTTTNIAGVS